MNCRLRGRSVFAGALAAIIAGTLCLGAGGQADSPGEMAAALAKKARKAVKEGQNADAYLLYSEAAALQPKNSRLRARMESLQSRAALQSNPVLPAALAAAALASPAPTPGDPQQVFDSIAAEDFSRTRQVLSPASLQATPGIQNFDLSGNARTLFDQVAQRFGLETVYDGDYALAGQSLRFSMPEVDYREALHALELMTGSFVIPLSPRLVMIAQDTAAKRNDLEQTVLIAVPVPQALTVQELTEIGQAVKQATNIEKIAWDTTRGEILMRDRISRVMPATALLEQLFSWRPQVMIELEFLEVSESDLLNYGFNVTTSIPAFYLGQVLRNAATIPSSVTALVTFGGGKTLFGLGVAQAQALFNESIGSTRSLFRAQVRSVDSQPATFHVGDRYPVITQGYFGPTSTQPGTVYQPPPSFTYEDLGVQLKVTPHVHGIDGITLAVETSYELLTGDAVNGIPIIGRRQLNSQVRLRDGEWAVVAGLIGSTDSKAQSGFAGLSQIPLLGNLFRKTTKDKEKQHVLIAIRPQLLSLPPDQIVTRALRVGSETRPFNPL